MEKIVNNENELVGTLDVIGLDVLLIHGKVESLAVAEELIAEATKEYIDMVEVNGDTFIIRATISDLNRVTSVIPEDLDARSAIQVQVKIADILQKAGINVGVTPDLPEEVTRLDAETENAEVVE
jgi:hypothetical protein